ncbi:MAG: hypothetical protein RLZZ210_855 [Pseudomonadota bacterium]|jgi:nucleotidyltransferase substrate binding protein (TIGR01987 family)
MQKETLNLDIFEKAVYSLKDALTEYAKDKTNIYVRDACIKRFEYCYDLSTKMIKRFLSITSEQAEDIQSMDFQNIIRRGFTKKILQNSWDKWWEYRANRNKTSHSYDEINAISIVEELGLFYDEILFLLEALKNKNEN